MEGGPGQSVKSGSTDCAAALLLWSCSGVCAAWSLTVLKVAQGVCCSTWSFNALKVAQGSVQCGLICTYLPVFTLFFMFCFCRERTLKLFSKLFEEVTKCTWVRLPVGMKWLGEVQNMVVDGRRHGEQSCLTTISRIKQNYSTRGRTAWRLAETQARGGRADVCHLNCRSFNCGMGQEFFPVCHVYSLLN